MADAAAGLAPGQAAPARFRPGTILYHFDAERGVYDVATVVEERGRPVIR